MGILSTSNYLIEINAHFCRRFQEIIHHMRNWSHLHQRSCHLLYLLGLLVSYSILSMEYSAAGVSWTFGLQDTFQAISIKTCLVVSWSNFAPLCWQYKWDQVSLLFSATYLFCQDSLPLPIRSRSGCEVNLNSTCS